MGIFQFVPHEWLAAEGLLKQLFTEVEVAYLWESFSFTFRFSVKRERLQVGDFLKRIFARSWSEFPK